MKSRLPAILCIAASIGMMSYGWARGEAVAVLKKAIVICLECIGIG